MNAAEVVVHEVDCEGVFVVFQCFTESVGEPGEPPVLHPKRHVLTFDKAG